MNDNAFDKYLDSNELIAWDCVKVVILNFLEKHRVQNYHILVDDIIVFENIGVNMSLKIFYTILNSLKSSLI